MIQAVTIDFWNTIVDSSNGSERRRVRNAAVRDVYRHMGRPWNEDEVHDALRISYETFEKHWQGEQRTLSASECLHAAWKHLDMTVDDDLHRRTVTVFEDSILDGLPALLSGVREALAEITRIAPIALISDTAFSPGRVLRKVLERHGVLQYFTALIFSDEVGVSKPHPRIFDAALSALHAHPAHTVHIGDLERTDIAGARGKGMRAILFRGDETGRYHHENAPEQTAANAVAHSWEEITHILRTWGKEGR